MEQQHMFTNRMIRNLLVPVVLEQILNSIMGTADTMMVSNDDDRRHGGYHHGRYRR